MKKCVNCNNSVNDSDLFCSKCGGKEFTTINNIPVNNGGRRCPQCGSQNINYQIVSHSQLKKQGRGCLYWIFIGWWLEIVLWIFLTLPRLLILIFGSKRKKIVNHDQKMAVCQNCGKSWRI